MRRLIGFLVVLAIVLFGLSFALLNQDAVRLDYYLGVATLPLSLALVLALIIGALLGTGAALAIVLRLRGQLARARRQLSNAEKELTGLRTQPVRDSA